MSSRGWTFKADRIAKVKLPRGDYRGDSLFLRSLRTNSLEAVGRSCSVSTTRFQPVETPPRKLSQSAVANSSPVTAPNRPLKPCNELASRYLEGSRSYFENPHLPSPPLPSPPRLSKERLEEQRERIGGGGRGKGERFVPREVCGHSSFL